MPIAIAVLQALPTLISTGFDVYNLVTHASSNPTAAPSPAETFAAQLLAALPGLISAGVDVTAMVQQGSALVATMVRENRGPTQAEKDDQTKRLAADDAGYDRAAGA